MKVTKIQLSDCIQKILKINTTGMTTDQMIKIIKNIISSNEFLPHCSLPNHNKKDNLCLSMNDLKKLAKENKIKVSQTREKLCKELESKGLLKIIRKSPGPTNKTRKSPSPKKKTRKSPGPTRKSPSPINKIKLLYPEEIQLFKKYNVKVDTDNLKKNYRYLQVKLHPDKGGNEEEFIYMMEWFKFREGYGFNRDAQINNQRK
jgi:SpoVK/Ycf46/Vps4 family AAA+-type ATPase